MRTTSKFLLAVLVLSAWCVSALAQTPDFRNRGYKGSISITYHYGVFVGAETSHGYMFDTHNYLGAGFGGFILPNSVHPVFLTFFADYQHYFGDKKDAPVLGLKTGFSNALNFGNASGVQYKNAILIEPDVAWSWGLKSGNALTLGLGCTLLVPVGSTRTDRKILPLPKISFAFEF